jgi:hypothetical protein
MKFITTIIKKFTPKKDISRPLGRWRIENCNTQMNHKIDLSNEDHCGPCGQYALEKVKFKNDVTTNIRLDNTK